MRVSLLLVVACSGEPAPPAETPSGETGSGSGTCAEGFYDGPLLVDTSDVSCGAGLLIMTGETIGWASHGFLFIQETADDPGAQWSEEHDVEDTLFDACGEWCVIEQQLEPVAGPELYEPDERTAFDCADDSGRSYAVGVYDLDGQFADCVAWGHDPQGLVDGTAGARANEPTNDLGACGIVTRP